MSTTPFAHAARRFRWPCAALPALLSPFLLFPAAMAISPVTQNAVVAPSARAWIDISPAGLNSTSPMDIAFTPKDPDTIYLGSALGGLFRSTDFGVTWTQNYDDFFVNPHVPTTWVVDIVFDPIDPTYGVAGTMSGTYLSTDSGTTWLRQDAPTPAMCVSMVSLDATGTVACADAEGDVHTFDWSTLRWNEGVPVNAQPAELSVDPSNPPNLYLATAADTPGTSMWVSRDQGESFYIYGEGLPARCGSVAADPHQPGHAIAACGPDLYYTDLGPQGLRPVWFPLVASGLPRVDILSLLFDPLQVGRVYAGTAGEGVFFSDNNGDDWQPLAGDGMEARYVIDLAIGDSHPEQILAACHAGGVDYGRLYRTEVPPRLNDAW